MYRVEDLKVGMIVKIRDLKEIYDTVIILTQREKGVRNTEVE